MRAVAFAAAIGAALGDTYAGPRGSVQVTAGDASDVAKARWLVAHTLYGIISTTSLHLNGSAFGNVNSFSDGTSVANATGRIFLYVSDQDASGQDVIADPRASFTISQQSTNATGCGGTDAEDPTCMHLTLSGTVVNASAGPQYDFAKAALFAKHPNMKSWPGDHSWLVQELVVTDIFFLDFYGGGKTITPEQYYAQQALVAPANGGSAPPAHPTDAAPKTGAKEQFARWLVHQSTWGVLTTTSVHLNGTAFGNVAAVSDGVGLGKENATGRLFFYLSPMDVQGADIAASPRCSFTVSEANLPTQFKQGKVCTGIINKDPESPLCARLSLNGKMAKLAGGDAELAQAALFSKHPAMAQWPSGHEFAFWELQITDTFFINMFGGADQFPPAAYYAAGL